MRKLLPILCLLIIASCSKEIPFDQLVERGGLVYEVNSQTPFSGRVVSYYYNGQLGFKHNYKDGLQDGLSEEYTESGQLERKGSYKDGKEDGPYESYFESGQLEKKTSYKDGKEDGLFVSYFKDGHIYHKGNYKDGEPDGLLKWYFERGDNSFGGAPEMLLKRKTSFKDGIRHGLSDFYSDSGRWVSSDCYKNGEKVERTPEQLTRYFRHGIEDANYLLEMSHCKK